MDAFRHRRWRRSPAWLNQLLLGSAVAVGLLMALVGAIAFLAQRTSDAFMPTLHYSVPRHALAMAAVAALTVAVAAGLVRLGQQLLAGVVLVGAVAGPMTVVAAPVQVSMVEPTFDDTHLWWHVVVAAALVVLLAAWTWWVDRCLVAGLGRSRRSTSWSVVRQVAVAALFAAVAVLSIEIYSLVPPQSNEPVMRAVVGWGLLAAGIVVVAALARTGWTALALELGVVATLGLVFVAYSRDGGWPGVAGWELNGMQSPIITSVASTGTLLVAPLLGAGCWLMRVAARGVHARLATATAEAAVG